MRPAYCTVQHRLHQLDITVTVTTSSNNVQTHVRADVSYAPLRLKNHQVIREGDSVFIEAEFTMLGNFPYAQLRALEVRKSGASYSPPQLPRQAHIPQPKLSCFEGDGLYFSAKLELS